MVGHNSRSFVFGFSPSMDFALENCPFGFHEVTLFVVLREDASGQFSHQVRVTCEVPKGQNSPYSRIVTRSTARSGEIVRPSAVRRVASQTPLF